jgi:hypothetical protein
MEDLTPVRGRRSVHFGIPQDSCILQERGWSLGRYDVSHEPSKVEIQSLFHGNTKDEDQI